MTAVGNFEIGSSQKSSKNFSAATWDANGLSWHFECATISKTMQRPGEVIGVAFKKANSVWATVTGMMGRDGLPDDGSPHIQFSIGHLTFDHLGPPYRPASLIRTHARTRG
jgi:hypothetical protein